MKKKFYNHQINPLQYLQGWQKAQQQYQLMKIVRNDGKQNLYRLINSSFILIAVLMSSVQLNAQNITQNIRGKVLDQESQMPLIGASIIILNSDPIKGASTDMDGYFEIKNVPVGRHTLKITSIGYEDNILPELEIISGKEAVLTIQMQESLTQLQEVVIKDHEHAKGQPINEMATVSSRSFSVEETQRYAASMNDPARMVQSFASVTTEDDGSNEIIVRGNSPRGVLWRVQGVEIPNPNHFGEEGSSGGGITMLNANMLSTSDFYSGAFPAEYGNGYSAVFDLFLRKGNNRQREYAAQAGVMGVDFSLEGPFKKGYDGSYLVNYRYSTLSLLDKMGVDDFGDAIPVFQDVSYNINLPTEKYGTFSLWGIGGLSSQEFEDESEDYIYLYNMGVTGLTHRVFLSEKTFLESVLSATTSINGFEGSLREDERDFEENFKNSTLRGSMMLNHKFNARHTLRAGAIVNYKMFDMLQHYTSADTAAIEVDADGATFLYQAYGQWKTRVNEKITVNAGMHALYLGLNGQSSFEPRLGATFQVSPTSRMNLGYGLHSRMESLAIYKSRIEGGEMPNEDLDFMKAHHFVVGFDKYLRPDLLLKTEVYYQMLKDVPIAPEGETDEAWAANSMLNYNGGLINHTLVNEGEGKNYGIELTVEKFFTNDYYFTITGSIYDSKYVGSNGVEFNTRFNGNYTANISAGKEYYLGRDDNNVLAINFRLLTSGGKRWTPVMLEQSIEEGEAVYDWSRAYSEREGSYFRGDLRISYRKNKANYSSIWSLDVQNFTNKSNIWSKYYDESTQAIETYYQVGLIPVISYKIEF